MQNQNEEENAISGEGDREEENVDDAIGEEREAGQGQEDDGMEGDERIQEEAAVPKVARNPGQPTQRERELHEATHIPPRSWCTHCMQGRGKDHYHKRLENSNEAPRVGMDYMFLTE